MRDDLDEVCAVHAARLHLFTCRVITVVPWVMTVPFVYVGRMDAKKLAVRVAGHVRSSAENGRDAWAGRQWGPVTLGNPLPLHQHERVEID